MRRTVWNAILTKAPRIGAAPVPVNHEVLLSL